jgi:hypothetical protein
MSVFGAIALFLCFAAFVKIWADQNNLRAAKRKRALRLGRRRATDTVKPQMRLFAVKGNPTTYTAAMTPDEAAGSPYRASTVWTAGVKMKKYRLVPFDRTWLSCDDRHNIILMEKGSDCPMLMLNRTFSHEDAWVYHRRAVLRFRRLQQAWKIAKHFPFLRQRVLRALEA